MEYLPTITSQIDNLKPSLFELLSESQLSTLLAPTLRYLLALATHRHPRYLLRLLNRYDEVHAVLFLLLERHYLRTYSASFTEHFYGLKRERVLRTRGGEVPRAQLGAPEHVRGALKLTRGDVWRNLLVLVGLPYIKRKLDESYDIYVPPAGATLPGLENDGEAPPEDATIRQRAWYIYKWFLRKVYPGVNAAWYLSVLAFNLAYLFDASRFHSPWLWLVGTRMRRMTQTDHQAVEDAAATAASAAASTTRGGARPGQTNSVLSPRVLTQTAASSLRLLLPTSIFALKFLEWWHASDFARQLSRKATEGLVLPPPIVSVSVSSRTRQRSEDTRTTDDEKDGSRAEKGVQKERRKEKRDPPISATTHLPILTVSPPSQSTASLCPICLHPIVTATASPYGYVYCYTCIHRWVQGTHDRQVAFMQGRRTSVDDVWADQGGDVEAHEDEGYEGAEDDEKKPDRGREGKWESGAGRCAVSGKRILGGTEGLRRVVV